MTWSSSTVFRPRRLERVAISTAPSLTGPAWAFSSSYRAMRSLFLVRRAWAPRMIHWYSTRRMDWRFRWAALVHLLLLGFLFQVLGIVGLVVADAAVGELGDPVAHPLQEVAVVGDHDQAPGELPQVVLQPEDHVAVQVVGGLVEDEHIRRVEEDGGQGHPLPLAPGEGVHRLGKVRDPQAGEHGLGLVLQQGPGVRGEVVKDLLQHRGPRHHLRVLGEEAHLDVGVQGDRPLVGDLLPRQHPGGGCSSPCR